MTRSASNKENNRWSGGLYVTHSHVSGHSVRLVLYEVLRVVFLIKVRRCEGEGEVKCPSSLHSSFYP